MTSQFATPLLLHTDGTTEGLRRIELSATADGSGYDEAWLGRAEAIKWFSENVNTFVNVFRPRIGRYQEEL